jgi:hypothetical protein
MRHSRLLLFSLALSGLVCFGSSAGAARVPTTCYSHLAAARLGQTFPETNYVCWGVVCVCLVTICPQLCRLGQGHNGLCAFVSYCYYPQPGH